MQLSAWAVQKPEAAPLATGWGQQAGSIWNAPASFGQEVTWPQRTHGCGWPALVGAFHEPVMKAFHRGPVGPQAIGVTSRVCLPRPHLLSKDLRSIVGSLGGEGTFYEAS